MTLKNDIFLPQVAKAKIPPQNLPKYLVKILLILGSNQLALPSHNLILTACYNVYKSAQSA